VNASLIARQSLFRSDIQLQHGWTSGILFDWSFNRGESRGESMWLKLSDDERTALRRITIVMVASYPVLVLICAVLNADLVPIFVGRPMMSWAELIYGPAITLVCVWAMLMVEVWIRLRFRKR
jgi:hypothetical protein